MKRLNWSEYCIYIPQLMLRAYRFPCVTLRNYGEETGSSLLQHD